MQLITPLINGFSDAPLGYAIIRRRGTGTNATCYTDYDGTSSTTTHTLDSDGRIERYVDEDVDITIYDVNGATVVDTFTFGHGFTAVEVRHAHHTGTDLTTGAAGLGEPLSGNELLDSQYASFGGDDWEVPVNNSDTPLKNAVGSAGGTIYNVRSPAYGALADGTTNDHTAISNAIVAGAGATPAGGVVVFPPGDYRITSALDLTIANAAKLAVKGWGPDQTFLSTDHATANWINLANSGPTYGYQTIEGIRFKSIQSTTGYNVVDGSGSLAKYRFKNCHFGGSATSLIRVQTAARYIFEDCIFSIDGTDAARNAFHSVNATGSGPVIFRNCLFIGPSGAFSPTNAIVYCGAVVMEGCEFDFSATTSGTGTLIDNRAMNGSRIIGCKFNCGSSSYTAINTGSLGNAAHTFYEDNNQFVGSEIPVAGWGTTGSYHFGSREAKRVTTASASATVNINMRDNAVHHINHTSGAALEITASTAALASCPRGARMWIVVNNTTGGNMDVTGNASYFSHAGSGMASTIPTSRQAIMIFVMGQDSAGNDRWNLITATVGLT